MTSYTPSREDILRLERDLNRIPEALDAAHQSYSIALAFGWRGMVLEVNAVDKWWYIMSIAAHRTAGGLDGEGTKQFVVDTSNNPKVIYSDIVERGRRDRPKYPVRYPAGKFLERQHRQDVFGAVLGKTLDKFLHAE